MVRHSVNVIYQEYVNDEIIKDVNLFRMNLIQRAIVKENGLNRLVAISIKPPLPQELKLVEIASLIRDRRFRNREHLASVVRHLIQGRTVKYPPIREIKIPYRKCQPFIECGDYR